MLKNKAAALAVILSLISGVAYSFFHPVTETHQALALSCLLFAVLTSVRFEKSTYGFYVLSLLIEIWCLVTHPIAVYTVSFVLALAFISTQAKRKWFLILFSFVLLMTLLRVSILKEPYDARQYDELFKFNSLIGDFFDLFPIRYLIRQYDTVYVAPSILITTSIIASLFNRKYMELFICMGFSLCLIVSTVITFNKGDTDGMMEKAFMPAIFMFAILFSINFYESSKGNLFLFFSLAVSCFFSFKEIVHRSEPFTKRLAMLEGISRYQAENNIPKLIANYSDFDSNILKFNEWSTSIDVLMLSTCKLNQPVTLFLTDDKNRYYIEKDANLLFLCLVWWPYWDKDDLNWIYFKIAYAPYKVYTKI
ncbi:MAG: hypothetical protein ABIT08_17805 [Bacteroidia bacterium]